MWPWKRCKDTEPNTGWRCDLKRGHESGHYAEGERMIVNWPTPTPPPPPLPAGWSGKDY